MKMPAHYINRIGILLFALLVYNCNAQPLYSTGKLKVAIFVYNGVEVLDFAGPAEVFSVTSTKDNNGSWTKAFEVFTVAASSEPITSQGFIEVIPDYSLDNCLEADIIILPGGSTQASRKDQNVLSWIGNHSKKGSNVLLSICTGAFLIGDAGLLDAQKATTWYGKIDQFRTTFPETEVLENVRYIDNGQIITTAGVSAGIDGSLHLVARIFGIKSATRVAKYMEYDKWNPDSGLVVTKKPGK